MPEQVDRSKVRTSRRTPSFTVTAAGERVTLDNSGEARAAFTVTNTSTRAVTGELVTKPRDPAKPEWFSIVGESIRDFTPNGAQQVGVNLKVPPGSAPGSYSFRLDAVAEDDPDEDYTEGPSVAFEVAPAPPPKKKFPWWILILVGAVVLLIVIGVVVWLLVRDTGPKTVAVPSVLGLSARGAESTLTNAGFTVKTSSVPVSDPTQNGLVQSQNPAAGTAQPPGTAVTITVGHMSLVPSVVGLDEKRATAVLVKADLKVAVRDVGVENPAQNGEVLDQSPSAGTLQPPGTVVRITVGRNIPVPNVEGLTGAKAEAVLTNAGFKVTVKFVPFSGDFFDIVSEQIPRPGTRLPLGSVVEIHVNRFRAG